MHVSTRPQTALNNFVGDELVHACRKIHEPISDLVPACVRRQNTRVVENHFSRVQDFGSSNLARFSSCWSKNPSGQEERRPSALIRGEDTTALPPSREK